MSDFYNDLTFIITTLVILSLSSYILFAYYDLKHPSSNKRLFINHNIAYSMMTIIETLIVIFKMVYIDYRSSRQYNYWAFISLTTLLLCLLIYYMIRKFIIYRQLALYPMVPIKLISTGFLGFILLFGFNDYYFIIVIIYYIISVCLFAIKTLKQPTSTSHFGIYYMLIGIFLIITNHFLYALFPAEFSLVVDLALSILLTIGFFLYYFDDYISSLETQLNEIQKTNKQLSIAEEKITFLAYYDPVTQLRNTHRLKKDLHQLKLERPYYLLLINIKDFKNLNNLLGYKLGNQMLRQLALILKDFVQEEDWLYHYYSDKFILIYQGSERGATALADQLFITITSTEFNSLLLSPYIGITQITPVISYDRLIKELEIASKKAKAKFAPFALYLEKDYINFEKSMDLEIALKKAVDQELWQMYYQPQIDTLTGEINGFEALIRWFNHDHFIPPDTFIPLAERLGFIKVIGDFVIKTVFQQSVDFFATTKHLHLSINLSAYQLIDDQLVDTVKKMMTLYNVPPHRIIFEITETALIHNLEKANKVIQALKAIGFQFSLDDFGTGYSSLYYFSQLDLDEVKFDKKFMDKVLIDSKSYNVFKGSVALFQSLGLRIVIEGIEQKAQLELIKEIGCPLYQGYYYSPPLDYNHAIALL